MLTYSFIFIKKINPYTDLYVHLSVHLSVHFSWKFTNFLRQQKQPPEMLFEKRFATFLLLGPIGGVWVRVLNKSGRLGKSKKKKNKRRGRLLGTGPKRKKRL